MMSIPHPWERTRHTDTDNDIRDNTHRQNGVMIVLVVDENRDDAVDQPQEPARRAPRVDTAEVLQCRRESKTDFEGWPLAPY